MKHAKERKNCAAVLRRILKYLWLTVLYKKIKYITMGERVYSASGRFCEVINVWRGKESDCYKIICESGFAVAATYNHPFLTDNGWKRANELKDGDKLLDEYGNSVGISRVEKTDETLNVVNLQFASPTIIIANGVQSGDFAIQNGKMPR